MKYFLINLIFKIFQEVQLLLQHCSERHSWAEFHLNMFQLYSQGATVYFCDIPRRDSTQTLSLTSQLENSTKPFLEVQWYLLRPERGHLHFPYLSSAANHVFASCNTRTSIIPNPLASKYFFIVFTIQKKMIQEALVFVLAFSSPFQKPKHLPEYSASSPLSSCYWLFLQQFFLLLLVQL